MIDYDGLAGGETLAEEEACFTDALLNSVKSKSVQHESVEAVFVHEVYENIAEHFSHTRYKAWPQIDALLRELPIGSVVVDLGCGNGKYAYSNESAFWLGSDRSAALLKCEPPFTSGRKEKVQADCLHSGLRAEVADVCLLIAVVHHLATRARRLAALREAVRVVKRKGGLVLLYVWAFEQQPGSIGARSFKKQDVLVPWVSPSKADHKTKQFDRYYHLFTQEEVVELCQRMAPMATLESVVFDANNWACRLRRA